MRVELALNSVVIISCFLVAIKNGHKLLQVSVCRFCVLFYKIVEFVYDERLYLCMQPMFVYLILQSEEWDLCHEMYYACYRWYTISMNLSRSLVTICRLSSSTSPWSSLRPYRKGIWVCLHWISWLLLSHIG